MRAHHDLGFPDPGGRVADVHRGAQGRWVALLGWGAAAFKCGPRDRWIGWTPSQQKVIWFVKPVDKFSDSDGFVAIGTGATTSDPPHEGSALVTALLADLASLAGWALIHCQPRYFTSRGVTGGLRFKKAHPMGRIWVLDPELSLGGPSPWTWGTLAAARAST